MHAHSNIDVMILKGKYACTPHITGAALDDYGAVVDDHRAVVDNNKETRK